MQGPTTYKELYEQGIKAIADHKYAEAETLLTPVFDADPTNPMLCAGIAVVYMQTNRNGVALSLFERALQYKPDLAEAMNNIGYLHEKDNRKDLACEWFHKALALKPDCGDFYNNLASAHVNNGTPQRCIEYAAKCIELDPDNVHAQWNRGLAYLELGDWVNGWAGYEYGLSSEKRVIRDYDNEKSIPMWDGSAGKTVVIHGEQGLGDEIMFASMIPDAKKDANLVLEMHPRLVNYYRRAWPDLPVYGTRKEQRITWPRFHGIQARLAIGSLGKFYRRQDADFPRTPYLSVDPELLAKQRARLAAMGDRPKIGIHWKGGQKITRVDLRSVPLAKFRTLMDAIDADWISLQYTPEAAAKIERSGLPIHHWQPYIDDLDEYGAMVMALDLVLSVNTTLVHLCGALGKECWCLTPVRCAWRYGLEGDGMPWYGSITQYRQNRARIDDWDPVLERVARDLQARFGAKEERTAA